MRSKSAWEALSLGRAAVPRRSARPAPLCARSTNIGYSFCGTSNGVQMAVNNGGK